MQYKKDTLVRNAEVMEIIGFSRWCVSSTNRLASVQIFQFQVFNFFYPGYQSTFSGEVLAYPGYQSTFSGEVVIVD